MVANQLKCVSFLGSKVSRDISSDVTNAIHCYSHHTSACIATASAAMLLSFSLSTPPSKASAGQRHSSDAALVSDLFNIDKSRGDSMGQG